MAQPGASGQVCRRLAGMGRFALQERGLGHGGPSLSGSAPAAPWLPEPAWLRGQGEQGSQVEGLVQL